jgi:hypothetical protein
MIDHNQTSRGYLVFEYLFHRKYVDSFVEMFTDGFSKTPKST